MTVRLLFVTRESFPTFRPDVADLFGKHLPRHGVESTLVAMAGHGVAAGRAAWAGGQARLGIPSCNRVARVVRSLVHDLAWVARESRGHQAVLVRDKILTAALALPLAWLRGRPLFYWMSFPFPDDDLLRARSFGAALGPARRAYTLLRGLATRWLLYRWVLRRCGHAFVQSERMREDLAGRGIPAAKLTPVPMGVDFERLDAVCAASRRAAPERGSGRLVYIGALDAARRPEFLLEVLAVVRRSRPAATLRLVGDAQEPADRQRLDERIRSSGLHGAVTVTGWLGQEEAWRAAASCDVGVCPLPSLPTTLSMSSTKAVELMALGLPLVVSAHPDQTLLVREGKAGISVPYDPEPFGRAVAGLLEDAAGAAAMGASGRAYVQAARSYEVLAQELAVRLREVLG